LTLELNVLCASENMGFKCCLTVHAFGDLASGILAAHRMLAVVDWWIVSLKAKQK
jgi:hypothetical protein